MISQLHAYLLVFKCCAVILISYRAKERVILLVFDPAIPIISVS